jgi:hypothetical protein
MGNQVFKGWIACRFTGHGYTETYAYVSSPWKVEYRPGPGGHFGWYVWLYAIQDWSFICFRTAGEAIKMVEESWDRPVKIVDLEKV